MSIKRDYICKVPFTAIEVHDYNSFLCCPSWLTKFLPSGLSVSDSWNSDEAKDIRDSILDGSYRYCDCNQCPYLQKMDNKKNETIVSPFFSKNNLPTDLKKSIDSHKNNLDFSPEVVQFSFDRTCNLKCPSCRVDLIVGDRKKIESVNAKIEEIENEYANDIKVLYITGSGDPFISVGFRDFLRNFNPKKYPKLEKIHLHTNATKWNKEMWDSMKSIHPYVTSCEISIDAATKDTYENKTRLGGKWNELQNNLKFISTLPHLKIIKTSFVVQNDNYKEMKLFYDMMFNIFGKKVSVYFGKILNWGHMSNDEFLEHQVWNPNHRNYSDFIEEVNRTLPANYCFHNLYEFIQPTKSII